MPLRPRIARTSAGMHPTIREYTLKSGEEPQAGDFVHLDANEQVVRTTAADPTPLLGIAMENHDTLANTGKILVAVATADLVLAMEGDDAPTINDLNQSYGIARDADGVWTVDGTDTTNTRVSVVDWHAVVGGIGQALYFVKVLAAHRQTAE